MGITQLSVLVVLKPLRTRHFDEFISSGSYESATMPAQVAEISSFVPADVDVGITIDTLH